MRNASFSITDRIFTLGVLALLVGTYLRWGIDLSTGTLGQRYPWEAAGFFPDRAMVLAVPALYVVLRVIASAPRTEVAVLAVAALVCVVYPPVRLVNAPLPLSPWIGSVVVGLSGLLFAVAATIRYATTVGIEDGNALAEAPAEVSNRP